MPEWRKVLEVESISQERFSSLRLKTRVSFAAWSFLSMVRHANLAARQIID
jgi:hypothetical protein